MKRVCLVCQCRGDEEGGEGCGASVVNFLLKIVLEVPGDKLRQEEEKEEEWRWICRECAEVVKQCKRIYTELREIWGKYRECKLGLAKLVKKDRRKSGDLEEKNRFLQEVHQFSKTYEYPEWTDPFLTERSLRTVEILELEERLMSLDQNVKEEPEETDEDACDSEKTHMFWNEGISDNGEESDRPASENDPLADIADEQVEETRSPLLEEDESWKGSSGEEDMEEDEEDDSDWELHAKKGDGGKRGRMLAGVNKRRKLDKGNSDPKPSTDKHLATCPHCNKGFSKYYLPIHVAHVHTKWGNFSCDFCPKKFFDRHNFKRHLKNVHKKTFTKKLSKPLKDKHQKQEPCPHCHKRFTPHYLERHIAVVHDKRESFTCDLCGKSYSDSYNLKRHYRDVHKVIRSNKKTVLVCPVENCGREYIARKRFEIHLKEHGLTVDNTREITPKEKIPEPEVKNSSNSESRLEEDHGNTRSSLQEDDESWKGSSGEEEEEAEAKINRGRKRGRKSAGTSSKLNSREEDNPTKPVACTVDGCKSRFKNKKGLKAHIKRYHPAKRRKLDDGDSDSEPSIDRQQVPCPHCHKSYDPCYLERHIGLVHEKRETVTCNLCGSSLVDRCGLKRHYREVHGETLPVEKSVLVCLVEGCGREYRHRRFFDAHMKEHEARVNTTAKEKAPEPEVEKPSEKRWVCQVCEKVFALHGRLLSHQANTLSCKRLHMPESDAVLTCPTCGAQCACPTTLRRHIEYVHQKKYKEMCHVCGSGQRNKVQLAKHLARTHSIGDYPCKEPGCKLVFSREEKLEYHVAVKHRGQEGRYKCKYCAKAFFTQSNRGQHERGVHKGVKFHSLYNKKKLNTEKKTG